MNLIDTLRAFARRWYIVLPGTVVAFALAFGSWHVVKPQYVRTASQVLLPGAGTLPNTSPNPYLFISGLTDAADVVVRMVGSNNVIHSITTQYPGVRIQVTRDPTTSGPVILTTVTASNDRDAARVLQLLVQRTGTTLQRLQTQEKIAQKNHITVTTLSMDNKSKLKQKKRLLATGGAGGGILVLTLLLASAVDGMRRSRELSHGRHGGNSGRQNRPRRNSDDDGVAAMDGFKAGGQPVVETDIAENFELPARALPDPASSNDLDRDTVGAGSHGRSWRE